MGLDRPAVAARAQDFDIPAGQLGSFQYRLPAAAARSAGKSAGKIFAFQTTANNGDPSHLLKSEFLLSCGERCLFGANAEAVAGIFHIAAGNDLAVDGFDRASNVEP